MQSPRRAPPRPAPPGVGWAQPGRGNLITNGSIPGRRAQEPDFARKPIEICPGKMDWRAGCAGRDRLGTLEPALRSGSHGRSADTAGPLCDGFRAKPALAMVMVVVMAVMPTHRRRARRSGRRGRGHRGGHAWERLAAPGHPVEPQVRRPYRARRAGRQELPRAGELARDWKRNAAGSPVTSECDCSRPGFPRGRACRGPHRGRRRIRAGRLREQIARDSHAGNHRRLGQQGPAFEGIDCGQRRPSRPTRVRPPAAPLLMPAHGRGPFENEESQNRSESRALKNPIHAEPHGRGHHSRSILKSPFVNIRRL